MTPQHIQRTRTKGWRMPPNTVSVTRPGKWGNPFPCAGNNKLAVQAFEDWIYQRREMYGPPPPSHEVIRRELAGKNLACWCKVGEPCHGDVLLKIANSK